MAVGLYRRLRGKRGGGCGSQNIEQVGGQDAGTAESLRQGRRDLKKVKEASTITRRYQIRLGVQVSKFAVDFTARSCPSVDTQESEVDHWCLICHG
jgi:hypothetical protein